MTYVCVMFIMQLNESHHFFMKSVIFLNLLPVGDCLSFFLLVDEIFVLLSGSETNKTKGLSTHVFLITDQKMKGEQKLMSVTLDNMCSLLLVFSLALRLCQHINYPNLNQGFTIFIKECTKEFMSYLHQCHHNGLPLLFSSV